MTRGTLGSWSRRAPTTRSWSAFAAVTKPSSRNWCTTGHDRCCCSPAPSSPPTPPLRRSSRTPGSRSSGASTGSRADPRCAPGSTGSWSTPRRSAGYARTEPCLGAAWPSATRTRVRRSTAALFRDADDPYPGHWRSFPREWRSSEGVVLAGEVRAQVRTAIDLLPDRQRVVITLRDVMGHSSDEVCQMLEISAANQRVLLHRARAAVRSHLAPYLEVDRVTQSDRRP